MIGRVGDADGSDNTTAAVHIWFKRTNGLSFCFICSPKTIVANNDISRSFFFGTKITPIACQIATRAQQLKWKSNWNLHATAAKIGGVKLTEIFVR